MNIEVQARDGVLKEPLPLPEKYVDLSYLKQAQKELGFYLFTRLLSPAYRLTVAAANSATRQWRAP